MKSLILTVLTAISVTLNSGANYSVAVLTQPSSPSQNCAVTNGSGTANANVTNIQIACTNLYTIGGTVINLVGVGGGLRLQDNGDDTLLVNANGTFTFATPLESGSAYNVTIFAEPSSPVQSCEVTQGTGTATANVTSVKVDCGHNEWTWVSGSDSEGGSGVYGTEGQAGANNVPGGREGAASWIDGSGNVWLFSGSGFPAAGPAQDLNDLWEFSGGRWTWVGGSNMSNQIGTYGTEGTAALGNVPGARYEATYWTDTSGNFWLFGGNGLDAGGIGGSLNDLWEFSSGEWEWVAGGDGVFQAGIYGTKGTPGPFNAPGARSNTTHWADAAGNLWLFGGVAVDSTGVLGYLNDLWEYSGGEWTWIGGSDLGNPKGTYGVEGTPSAANAPGGRQEAAVWIDGSGNVWLFGGNGYHSAGVFGELNDLWEYSAGEWTWMGGPNVVNQKGTYGSEGTASSGNIPGARQNALFWADANGNFWLFGGFGYDAAGTPNGILGDLWKYGAGQWTWVGGSAVHGNSGIYATQGTPSPANVPGARFNSNQWTDSNGNLWLFGGYGCDSTATCSVINDLWKYEP